ncbi:MAG: PilN domain-containing protein [Phycisphaeraceae bacterium]
MNQVNFLPETFVTDQARMSRIYRQIALIIGVAVCMVGYMTTSRSHLASVETYADNLETEVAAAKQQMNELTKLQQRYQGLTHQLRIQRELALPLRHSQIVATLGQQMPESIALTDLRIDSHLPATRGKYARALAASPNSVVPAEYKPVLELEMTGLAASDLDIANFVGALSDHPLFSDVKMHFSRTIRAGDLIGRQFRLSMQVRLDCDYKPTSQRPVSSGPGSVDGDQRFATRDQSHQPPGTDREVADAH